MKSDPVGTYYRQNTVMLRVCKKWIHKRCSGIRGNLSLVVDGFRCNRCDGRSPISTSMFMTTAVQTLDEKPTSTSKL